MKKIITLCSVAALTLFPFAGVSLAADTTTGEAPQAVTYAKVNLAVFSSCRLLVGLKAQTGGTEQDCPKDVAKYVKSGYPDALKSAKGNAEAISLLKQFREAMLNAVATIQPLLEERKISYQLRQEKAEAELTRLANRVEMEL